MKKAMFSVLVVLTILGIPARAFSAYPDRPVTIIVPFGEGGAVDIAARILARYFHSREHITLDIVCKGGDTGVSALAEVARAAPDGYTLGFPAVASLCTTPHIKKTPYSLKDFCGIAQITNMWLSLAVRSDSGIKDIHGLMKLAEQNPGTVTFATFGALSIQRMLMERMLKLFPGTRLPHVSYPSGYAVSLALRDGRITTAFGVTINHKPFVQSGEFTLIGVSSPVRLPDFPDVPTFAEQLNDEFTFAASHGLIAPAGVPEDRIRILQELIKKALSDPWVQAEFAKAGLTADYLPSKQFQAVLENMWESIGVIFADYTLK